MWVTETEGDREEYGKVQHVKSVAVFVSWEVYMLSQVERRE